MNVGLGFEKLLTAANQSKFFVAATRLNLDCTEATNSQYSKFEVSPPDKAGLA